MTLKELENEFKDDIQLGFKHNLLVFLESFLNDGETRLVHLGDHEGLDRRINELAAELRAKTGIELSMKEKK